MTQAPLVDTTAVVPYWDLDPAFLADAISSIASSVDQPRTIVVDNASSVPLPELPPWVEVLRLPSRVTLGVARNAGLERVATPWVLFLDADDMLADGTLDRWRAVAAKHPGAVIVRGARHRRHGTDEVVRRHHWIARLDGHPGLIPAVNTFRMCVGTSTALMRTDAVRAAGGYRRRADRGGLGAERAARVPRGGRARPRSGDDSSVPAGQHDGDTARGLVALGRRAAGAPPTSSPRPGRPAVVQGRDASARSAPR